MRRRGRLSTQVARSPPRPRSSTPTMLLVLAFRPSQAGDRCRGRARASRLGSRMVRRGSTVRVRQRAYTKCLQIGTLMFSAQRTARRHSDTFLVRATQAAALRHFATHLVRAQPTDPAWKSPLTEDCRCLLRRNSDPLPPERGSIPSPRFDLRFRISPPAVVRTDRSVTSLSRRPQRGHFTSEAEDAPVGVFAVAGR
jgi:hypothetical protein